MDDASGDDPPTTEADAERELRERVEEEYDFEDFGPAQMAEMSAAEWEAAFDPDSWVTGPELLDRVENDLAARVARRDVFAVVERDSAPDGERLVAYSEQGYAAVYGDGSVVGRGTVLRDVKATVALCSMPDYEVPDVPADGGLPDPDAVSEGTGDLGNRLLQVVGGIQILAGAALLLAPLLFDPIVRAACAPPAPGGTAYTCTVAGRALTVYPLGESLLVAVVAGLGFLAFGVFLLVVVANARLSDRFRSEEYRERLRRTREADERPPFVPGPDEPALDGGADPDGDTDAAG